MQGLVISLLRAYRYALSPFLGYNCRFHPSCSEYALQAIQHHGLWRGGWLAGRRLLRCHPWHPGGYDPVPKDDSRNIAEHG
jgi:putative membrane protein insertion efficiency factor